MPEERQASDPQPIIPNSEKAIGAIDLGLITGATAIMIGMLVVRWAKLRAAAKLSGDGPDR
jgi:hypothetical protein